MQSQILFKESQAMGFTFLETQIRQDGIYVRFFPFIWKFRHYPWSELRQVFVRTYHPIAEYGGWGYRIGFFGRGKAFNMSGNEGIQLIFKDENQLLIGTKKPKEAAAVLQELGYLNPNDFV